MEVLASQEYKPWPRKTPAPKQTEEIPPQIVRPFQPLEKRYVKNGKHD